ncbi:hypothetical protein SAMN04488127_0723 [Bhargavaea ginsengi]|uniref:Uncharacterized protein n=1 Tax=Bhargavaea ginsengi TaxID=426757 RepID=A0A1H6UMX6_9BACL|nr:hypothetical protein [Bhargavaea ginsengi]SEI89252.1 hypothetical protein SAMN04488127_0723 [Bhargavaea ginsengi]
MENMLNEIEKGLEAGVYHLALGMTLCIPDICAALQSNNGETKKNKYVNWYDQYVGDKVRMSANDCYYFRCAFLHQGRTEHKDSQYRKIIFIEPTSILTLHNNVLNDVLNIDIQIFCRVIIDAARNWYEEQKDTKNYKSNFEHSFKRHPEGMAPYIVGVPVYG